MMHRKYAQPTPQALRKATLLMGAAALVLASSLYAIPTGFHTKDLATGLDAVSAAVLPDGRILAVEKYGKVTLIKDGVKQSTPFMNWESNTQSAFEKGMMTITPDPDFLTNHYIYVWYCDKRQGGNGQDRVSRFTVVGDAVDGNSEKLMISLGDAGKNYHHGSGISIGPDGKLWIASGCRGDINDGPPGPANAADKNRVEGKMLRINLDGSIPTDNPFYSSNTGDARAVYYYGLRNPFTMSWRGDKLWFNEVQSGSGNDKTLEGGPAGTDYGFQNRGGAASLWTASKAGANTRAMIGALWYKGKNFPSEWQDLYYFGGVAGDGSGAPTNVNLLAYNYAHSGSPKNFGSFQCPIDIKEDALGAMYVTTRCQTENARYGTGKVTRIWYGDTEPPYVAPVEVLARNAAERHLKWSVRSQSIRVESTKEGAQTLELRDVSGKLLAKRAMDGKGVIELPVSAEARGALLLVWNAGATHYVAKLVH
jgi:glucose/arabinose dehydrogenase